jgi:hypothetical protein
LRKITQFPLFRRVLRVFPEHASAIPWHSDSILLLFSEVRGAHIPGVSGWISRGKDLRDRRSHPLEKPSGVEIAVVRSSFSMDLRITISTTLSVVRTAVPDKRS